MNFVENIEREADPTRAKWSDETSFPASAVARSISTHPTFSSPPNHEFHSRLPEPLDLASPERV